MIYFHALSQYVFVL